MNEKIIERRVLEELPFMATENILMACVKKGGDRQDLHERIREHSHAAGGQVKQEGKENDLLERIAHDSAFQLTREELSELLNVSEFIGRSPEQVVEYLEAKGALV